MTRDRRSLVAVLATVVALAVSGFIYSNIASSHAVNVATSRSNAAALQALRSFCALVGTLDASYQEQPPTTATGRLVSARVHTLYVAPPPMGLGCPTTGSAVPLPTSAPSASHR